MNISTLSCNVYYTILIWTGLAGQTVRPSYSELIHCFMSTWSLLFGKVHLDTLIWDKAVWRSPQLGVVIWEIKLSKQTEIAHQNNG